MLRPLTLVVFLLLAAAGAVAIRILGGLGSPLGELAIEPREIDFGHAPIGSIEERTLIATNLGDAELVVSRIHTEAPFRSSTASLALAPGESRAIVVSFLPQEEKEVRAELRFESDAAAGGAVSIPLRGAAHRPAQIALDPLSIRFGDVRIDQTSKALLTITNRGGEELQVESLATLRPFTAEASKFELAPGEARSVEVSFRPDAGGSRRGSLSVRTNDPARPDVTVPLEGRGVSVAPRPALDLSPPALDFGTVTACGVGRQWLSIRNAGEDPLTITSVTLAPPFAAPTEGSEVLPGSTLRLPVVFAPAKEGAALAPLAIYSNDPETPVRTVSLLGTSAGACTDQKSAAHKLSAGSLELAELYGFGDAGLPRFALNPKPAGAGSGGSDGGPDGGSDPGDPGQGSDPDPGDTPEPGPTPLIREGSRVYLETNEGIVQDFHVEAVRFDPDSAMLSIEGLTLPTIDGTLGDFFEFTPTNGYGQVSPNGDVEMLVPIEFMDDQGTSTLAMLTLTTGTATAVLEGGTPVAVQGRRLAADGTATLVGATRLESGPLQGHAMEVILNVQVR